MLHCCTAGDSQTRFTLILKRARFICHFTSPERHFLFFPSMSASIILSSLSGVQPLCSQPHLHAVIAWGKPSPRPVPSLTGPESTKTLKYRQRAVCLHAHPPQHIYRGPEVTIEQQLLDLLWTVCILSFLCLSGHDFFQCIHFMEQLSFNLRDYGASDMIFRGMQFQT